MNFADALSAAQKRPGNPCSFAKLRAGLSKQDQEQLTAALDDRLLTHSQIARAVSLLTGTKIDNDIIGRHRRGDCRNCADA